MVVGRGGAEVKVGSAVGGIEVRVGDAVGRGDKRLQADMSKQTDTKDQANLFMTNSPYYLFPITMVQIGN